MTAARIRRWATPLLAVIALLLIAAPAHAADLSASEAETIARQAEGIPALAQQDPRAAWGCTLTPDDAIWTCTLRASSDGGDTARVRIADADGEVLSVDVIREAVPDLAIDQAEAIRIGEGVQRADAWADRYRDDGRAVNVTASLDTGTWKVAWTSDGTRIAEVGVSADDGAVSYVRTGPQVTWGMARGGKGFGRAINEPYVFGPLLLLFAILFIDWRRIRSWRTLDILAICSMAASLWFFVEGEVFLAVPLQYPPLIYLLVRLIAIGMGRSGRTAFTTHLPVWALVAILILLVGGRIGLNAYSSNVVDVGYAGVVGASRILDGQSPYGTFPKKTSTPSGERTASGSYRAYIQEDGRCEAPIERGDTYGPAMYLAYLPATLALGWDGLWDVLPAAHVTSGLFDGLAGLGLLVAGWRLQGRRLGLALAVFWFAVPWPTYTFMAGSNDGVVAALLAWSAALWAKPLGRGALLAFAALAKFAPILLIPLWLRIDRPPAPVPGEWPYGRAALHRGRLGRAWLWVRPTSRDLLTLLGMAAATLALAALLIALDGTGALRTFWDRTFGWQLDRPSPFSIWDWGQYPGLPDLARVQQVLKVLLIIGAALLFLLPRRLDQTRILAFAAALMVGFQLVLTHWMYLYLPWVIVFTSIALLAPKVDLGARRRATPPALPMRTARPSGAVVPVPEERAG